MTEINLYEDPLSYIDLRIPGQNGKSYIQVKRDPAFKTKTYAKSSEQLTKALRLLEAAEASLKSAQNLLKELAPEAVQTMSSTPKGETKPTRKATAKW